MTIRVGSKPSRIADLRGSWNGLVDRCSSATFFQTWEWNFSWWEAYGRSDLKARLNTQLRLVEAWEGGDLVGLLPLWRSRRRKALRFLGEHVSDYLMPIVRDDVADEVHHQFAAWLTDAARSDTVELRDVPRSHPWVELMPSSSASEGAVCPYVELPSDPAELLARISSNLRHAIRKAEREIVDSGRGRFWDADRANWRQAIGVFDDLYRMRAQAKGLDRVLADPHRSACWTQLAELAIDAGSLRLKLLDIDGTPACGILCFSHRDAVSYYAQGMAPAFGNLAPGNLVLWSAVQDAIQAGAREFDFLRGNEDFKARWRPVERGNVDIVL